MLPPLRGLHSQREIETQLSPLWLANLNHAIHLSWLFTSLIESPLTTGMTWKFVISDAIIVLHAWCDHKSSLWWDTPNWLGFYHIHPISCWSYNPIFKFLSKHEEYTLGLVCRGDMSIQKRYFVVLSNLSHTSLHNIHSTPVCKCMSA